MKRRTFLKTAIATAIGGPLVLKDEGFWATVAGIRLKIRKITSIPHTGGIVNTAKFGLHNLSEQLENEMIIRFFPPMKMKANQKYYIPVFRGDNNEISVVQI